jgi:purine nucleoside permease
MATFNDLDFQDPGYSPPAEYDLEFFEGPSLPILKGDSNYFTAVWVANGRLMVAAANALSVVDLDTNTLIDWYTETHAGAANEVLNSDDITDLVGG